MFHLIIFRLKIKSNKISAIDMINKIFHNRIIVHKFSPVVKEIQPSPNSVSYFTETIVFIIAKADKGIANTDKTKTT